MGYTGYYLYWSVQFNGVLYAYRQWLSPYELTAPILVTKIKQQMKKKVAKHIERRHSGGAV